nr:helitron helicase-like domain-containing protein [Tanacetum cinerariifolium]
MCNSVVVTWILNFISPELFAGATYVKTASEIWNDLKETCDKVGHPNGTQALITKIGDFKINNEVTLYDVLVVPEYTVSLLSIHKLSRDKLSPDVNEGNDDSGATSMDQTNNIHPEGTPLLSGGYRSPQSNCSVGGKVVVLDFGNSEVRLESCESFFRVNHSEGSPHCAYEFPNDSPFSRSYIRSSLTILDFKNCLTRSVDAGNELRRMDAHKSTPSNVRWGQSRAQTDTGVTGSYIDIGDCEWVCEYFRATFLYGERLKRDNNFLRPHYHRCCSGGKVVCKWPCEPPAGIKEVFKNEGFQEIIRAYNQMFAMTSFGACINDSVNRLRGP